MAETSTWKSILETALRCYPSRAERYALRSGLENAACLCDAIGRDLPEKDAAIAKLCADAIWTMRSKIQVPHG